MQMKMRFALLAVVLLQSCHPRPTLFKVEVPDGDVASVNIETCGDRAEMEGNGRSFVSTRRIDCEGSGRIEVIKNDGSRALCHISYFTPRLPIDWSFVVTNGECELVEVNGEPPAP